MTFKLVKEGGDRVSGKEVRSMDYSPYGVDRLLELGR